MSFSFCFEPLDIPFSAAMMMIVFFIFSFLGRMLHIKYLEYLFRAYKVHYNTIHGSKLPMPEFFANM